MPDTKLVTVDGLVETLMRGIEHWVEMRDDKHLRLFLSRADKLRLLKLRTWCMRYKLSLSEVLDLIVPVLRKTGAYRPGPKSFGIRMSALTGDTSCRILEDRVLLLYPEGANVSVWRERERERQLQAERDEASDGVAVREQHATLLACDSIESFVGCYSRQVTARRVSERDSTARWRKRRKYRGNPWL